MFTWIPLLILFTFLLNTAIAVWQLYADKLPFSLNQVFWIFCLVFMSLAPAAQFLLGVTSWDKQLQPLTFVWANGLLFACYMCYIWMRHNALRTVLICPAPYEPSYQQTDLKRYRYAGNGIYAICVLLLLWLNIDGLWWRGTAEQLRVPMNSSLQLLSDKVLRGAVLYFVLLTIGLFRKKRVGPVQLILVLAAGIATNFPLAVARYWMATFYIAILLFVLIKFLYGRRHMFTSVITGALILLFPLLGLVRYSRTHIAEQFGSLKDVFRFSLKTGDFDAYTSLCATLEYVHQHGITWGRQLLTVLLFFVPRTVWPGKSIGSGGLVNRVPGHEFVNYCSPLFAEGYINFGVIGSLLFTGLFAYIVTRYDRFYWNAQKGGFSRLFYPIAIGMFFFILRGDLLSSFAYTVGIYIAGGSFHLLLYRK